MELLLNPQQYITSQNRKIMKISIEDKLNFLNRIEKYRLNNFDTVIFDIESQLEQLFKGEIPLEYAMAISYLKSSLKLAQESLDDSITYISKHIKTHS